MARKSAVGSVYAVVGGMLWYEGSEALYMVDDDNFKRLLESPYTTAIRIESLSTNWEKKEWVSWDIAVVETIDTEFTIRKERRGVTNHWYAYRKVHGTQYKRYVGRSEDVTERRLLEIAQKLPTKGKGTRMA